MQDFYRSFNRDCELVSQLPIIQLNLQFYKKPYYSLSDQVSVNIYSISMDYSSF